ncbi:MAG: hypothetical protein V4437_00750 [Patescibacteria group bacterium]
MKKIFSTFFIATAVLFVMPLFAYAHEVYVLSRDQVNAGLIAPPFSMLEVARANADQFFFWGFIAILVVVVVFFVSILRWFENVCDPLLIKAKHYAPAVARITLGVSFIAAAHYQAIFGPELPLLDVFGSYASLARAALVGIGILIVLGWYVRFAALAALLLFSVAALKYGSYMFTYTSYIGEIAVLLLIGAHRFGLDRFAHAKVGTEHFLAMVVKKLAPYSFLVLRVSFGFSLLFASLYAKFLHNALALQVATLPLAGHAHSLAYYFGFEPHFLVLGAGILEVVLALFFIFGLEIRFTALFIEFWLLLSLWYFGESVWPHIILIGIPIAFFLYGYDRFSLEGLFFKKGNREPVF